LNPAFHFYSPIPYNTDYLTFYHPPEGRLARRAYGPNGV
jgi:hypothetical protein